MSLSCATLCPDRKTLLFCLTESKLRDSRAPLSLTLSSDLWTMQIQMRCSHRTTEVQVQQRFPILWLTSTGPAHPLWPWKPSGSTARWKERENVNLTKSRVHFKNKSGLVFHGALINMTRMCSRPESGRESHYADYTVVTVCLLS